MFQVFQNDLDSCTIELSKQNEGYNVEQSFFQKHLKTILLGLYIIVFNLILSPIYLLMIEMSQQTEGAGIKEGINAVLLVFLPFFLLPTIVIFGIGYIIYKIYRKVVVY